MKRACLLSVACVALLPLGFARPARAQSSVPTLMAFQGRLAKPDGTPTADVANQSLTFRLYSAQSGGTLLWQQTGTLPVRNGTFAAKFDFSTGYQGSATFASVFNGAPVYLEVQVGTAAPLSPRQLLTSNAYAFTAQTALTALSVAAGSIGLNQLAAGVLNFSNIAGQITLNQIAPGVLNFSNLGGQIGASQIGSGVIGAGNLTLSLQQTLGFLSVGALSDPVLTGSVPTGSNPQFVAVAGNYAYVVNTGSNTLQIFDVSNPAAPALKGSATTDSNPYGVVVSGNYAYVVNRISNSLQVFDVSNPAAPVLKGSAGTDNNPTSVTIAGSYAYVVNRTSNSLQVFDVSNPTAPTLKGSAGTDSNPFRVTAAGNYVYIVHFDSNSLQIFDVSNPVAPTLRGRATTDTHPYGVTIAGSYAYVVNWNSNSLQVFDVSNPAAPVLKGSAGTGSYPESVAVSGSYAYVVNTISSSLQVFDVSNPAAPTSKGGAGTGTGPSSIAVAGNYAYVVTSISNSSLQVFQMNGLAANGSLSLSGGLRFGDGTLQTTSFQGAAAGGDLTGTYPNPVIAANAVTTTKLASNAASLTKVSGGALTLSNGNLGVGTTTPGFPLTFLNTLGDKISLWGQAGAHYGLGVQANLLQIHSDISASDIAFGYGSSDTLTELMRIKGSGNVGIGTSVPAYKLDVNGTGHFNGNLTVNSTTYTSDARYKMNIATFPNALDTVLGLRGVTFDWNRDQWQAKNFPAGRQVGFLAQEVESVLPELVTTDASGYKSVAYQNVVPVLVEAVKTLKKDNDAKQQRIEMLQADNNAKTAEITTIKARLDAIEKLLLRRKP